MIKNLKKKMKNNHSYKKFSIKKYLRKKNLKYRKKLKKYIENKFQLKYEYEIEHKIRTGWKPGEIGPRISIVEERHYPKSLETYREKIENKKLSKIIINIDAYNSNKYKILDTSEMYSLTLNITNQLYHIISTDNFNCKITMSFQSFSRDPSETFNTPASKSNFSNNNDIKTDSYFEKRISFLINKKKKEYSNEEKYKKFFDIYQFNSKIFFSSNFKIPFPYTNEKYIKLRHILLDCFFSSYYELEKYIFKLSINILFFNNDSYSKNKRFLLFNLIESFLISFKNNLYFFKKKTDKKKRLYFKIQFFSKEDICMDNLLILFKIYKVEIYKIFFYYISFYNQIYKNSIMIIDQNSIIIDKNKHRNRNKYRNRNKHRNRNIWYKIYNFIIKYIKFLFW